MTVPEKNRDTLEWRPEWQGDDLAEYTKARERLRSQVASFRELRRALKLSQAQAAMRLATTQSNVSKIEAKTDLSLATLRRLLGDDGELRLVAHLKNGKDIEFALND